MELSVFRNCVLHLPKGTRFVTSVLANLVGECILREWPAHADVVSLTATNSNVGISHLRVNWTIFRSAWSYKTPEGQWQLLSELKPKPEHHPTEDKMNYDLGNLKDYAEWAQSHSPAVVLVYSSQFGPRVTIEPNNQQAGDRKHDMVAVREMTGVRAVLLVKLHTFLNQYSTAGAGHPKGPNVLVGQSMHMTHAEWTSEPPLGSSALVAPVNAPAGIRKLSADEVSSFFHSVPETTLYRSPNTPFDLAPTYTWSEINFSKNYVELLLVNDPQQTQIGLKSKRLDIDAFMTRWVYQNKQGKWLHPKDGVPATRSLLGEFTTMICDKARHIAVAAQQHQQAVAQSFTQDHVVSYLDWAQKMAASTILQYTNKHGLVAHIIWPQQQNGKVIWVRSTAIDDADHPEISVPFEEFLTKWHTLGYAHPLNEDNVHIHLAMTRTRDKWDASYLKPRFKLSTEMRFLLNEHDGLLFESVAGGDYFPIELFRMGDSMIRVNSEWGDAASFLKTSCYWFDEYYPTLQACMDAKGDRLSGSTIMADEVSSDRTNSGLAS